MSFEVAAGKCGITKHPQRCVRQCPVGVCHVYCRRQGWRGVGGCSMEEGDAFFRERLKPWELSEQMADITWADWKSQLGLLDDLHRPSREGCVLGGCHSVVGWVCWGKEAWR